MVTFNRSALVSLPPSPQAAFTTRRSRCRKASPAIASASRLGVLVSGMTLNDHFLQTPLQRITDVSVKYAPCVGPAHCQLHG